MEIMVRFNGKEFSEKKSFKNDTMALAWVQRNIDKIEEINYHVIERYCFNADGKFGTRKLNSFELFDIIKDIRRC